MRRYSRGSAVIVVRHVPDELADVSYLDRHAFRARKAQYRRGDFYHMGIVVTVEVGGVELLSGALWGVESDSDPAYLRTIARECARDAVRHTRRWFSLRADAAEKARSRRG